MNSSLFTKRNTNIAKGIAVLMLLFHHLFLYKNVEVIDLTIGSHSVASILAVTFKVCVAIFLILSGFGLYESNKNKTLGIFAFYKKSFYKLYKTYWLIWIIFVPIGILLFGRTVSSVWHGDSTYNYIHLLLNILGIHYIFSDYGYNPTWWFMTLIILLYFLFPLIRYLINKAPNLLLGFSFVLAHLTYFNFKTDIPGYGGVDLLMLWSCPFVLGMYISKFDLFNKFNNSQLPPYIRIGVNILVCLGFSILKFTNYIIGGGTRTDALFGLAIILLSIDVIPYIGRKISNSLELYGKFSFSIFLFHNFIYEFYFKSIIYAPRFPIVIFIWLALICLLIAMGLDKLSNKIFNRFQKKSKSVFVSN